MSGITVPPGEAAPLAAAISRLLNNPDLRARYGAHAARRVRDDFSARTMAERTLDVYRGVLSNHFADHCLRL